MNNNFDYSEDIEETTNFKCDTLNIYYSKKNKGVIINKINKDNFIDKIKYALEHNFEVSDTNKVNFATFGKIINFKNLIFENLSHMSHGFIFRIICDD
jgi:hypothetical protein